MIVAHRRISVAGLHNPSLGGPVSQSPEKARVAYRDSESSTLQIHVVLVKYHYQC